LGVVITVAEELVRGFLMGSDRIIPSDLVAELETVSG
jgi:hypothetical protein